jgi:hypothetical protein
MLRRKRLHAVEREQELKISRLLAPKRAIVIEGGNALVLRNEVRRTFRGHFLDEFNDRLFRRGVIPRGKRVGKCGEEAAGEDQQREWGGFHGENFRGSRVEGR